MKGGRSKNHMDVKPNSIPLLSLAVITSPLKLTSSSPVIISPLKQDSKRYGCYVLVTSLNFGKTQQENVKILQQYVS